MKEIKETETRYIIKYQAIDGEIFNTKEECEKYDSTAKAVITSKFNKLEKVEYSSWDVHGGSDDNVTLAIKIKSQKDADILLQRFYLDNSWVLSGNDERYRDKYESMVEKALKEKDFILIGYNCDDEMYFINTRNTLVNNLNNLGNEANTKQQD